MSTFRSTTRYAVVSSIGLWVLTVVLVGFSALSTTALDTLLLLSWMFLPLSVGINATAEPTCEKRQAVLYTLGSTIPLLGLIPASVYLGKTGS